MRDILHVDLNNFYASCEIINNPSLKNVPVAVGGSEDDRHGIVLAKNYLAKDRGITTGMTLYQAKKLCPDIVFVDVHFDLYNKYSKIVREILLEYTDRVEPFSIDESWLDVTHSKIFGSPKEIADKIREEVKQKTGLTVSVGVSFNKIFAKLGSDLKKPDATTVISIDNFKKIVWPLDADTMMGVGKHTYERLKKVGIKTIGDIAKTDKKFLEQLLGKMGVELYEYANGNDDDEVRLFTDNVKAKSIGNSTTFYKDITDIRDIELGFTILCENVSHRMIKHNFLSAGTISITVKYNDLTSSSRQTKFDIPCRDSQKFTEKCMELYNKNYKGIKPVRLLGVSVTDLSDRDDYTQISFFDEPKKDIDKVILSIRDKYGYSSIVKANNLLDKKIASTFDPQNEERQKKEE